MKRRNGRHRKPEPQRQSSTGAWPIARGSFAQVLVNSTAPGADVPPELRSADYEFPCVELPQERARVSSTELRAALNDDTQPLEPVVLHFANDFLLPPCEPGISENVAVTPDGERVTCRECLNWLAHVPPPSALDGFVLDETPQAARHEGLAPAPVPHIPVPSIPFLNAHAARPRHESDEQPTQVIVHVGNALPARLSAPELMLLGRTIPGDAPPAVRPPVPSLPAPARRDHRAHALVFAAFDADFWEEIETTVRQQQAGPGGMRMSVDAAMDALDEHLAAVDTVHRQQIERGTGVEYAVWLASQLADADRPLPRRNPGASLAPAIETPRGELVAR